MEVIVILYYTRGVFPLRTAIQDHLYSWENYSKYKTIYINVAFGIPWNLLKGLKVRAIIFHTIFLSMRWSLPIFQKRTLQIDELKGWNCNKIAIPQDEFIHTEQLSKFLSDINITHIYSCAEKSELKKIYPYQDHETVTFNRIMTGYLDEKTILNVNKLIHKEKYERTIDIGYRAWKAAFWLGGHGRHKVRIAELSQELGLSLGLNCDISMEDNDVLLGLDWYRFLLKCKSTIGVEGGASILDADGSIKTKVDSFLQENPTATFEETREKCFADSENNLKLSCISPRHLEACLTKTCQLLIEGNYNDVLKPNLHYYPIKQDYSNLNEAITFLQDNAAVERMTKTAYEDIVLSNKFTYRALVQEIENEAIDISKIKNCRNLFTNFYSFILLKYWDKICWLFIRFECYYLQNFNNKTISSKYNLFKKINDKLYLVLSRTFNALAA